MIRAVLVPTRPWLLRWASAYLMYGWPSPGRSVAAEMGLRIKAWLAAVGPGVVESSPMELLQASIIVKGQGFTPQLINATTLQDVFSEPPSQELTLPPLAVFEYPSGYQLLVQEDRIDLKRLRSPQGVDLVMQSAIQRLVSFWPLVQPTAIGMNFQMAAAYEGELTQESMLDRLTPRNQLEETFGEKLIGSKHSFVFRHDPAKVTVGVTTDAVIAERAGFVINFNAHHEPVPDVQQVVESQAEWYDRIKVWAEELVSKPW